MLTEAPPEAVVWVDKSRRRSVAAPDSAQLAELVGSLGTQFNIRLAKTLRATAVLFVEGQDMKLIRQVAELIGAERVSREIEITVVPLEGFSNWDRIEPFKWLVNDLLHDTLKVFVVLDRDYRPEVAVRSVRGRLQALGISATIWSRKELENYFLVPTSIARAAGLPTQDVQVRLHTIAAAMETDVFALFTTERQRLEARDRQVQAVRAAKDEFDALWAVESNRLHMCPPKEVLSRLNEQLQSDGHKAINFGSIVRSMAADEVPSELRRAIERVNDALEA